MIVLSNTTAQTIQPGQAITFDTVVLHSGCAEYHRGGSPSVRLRASGIYEMHFTGNVAAATAGDILKLAMSYDGSVLPETTMIQTPAAANAFAHISAATITRNCGLTGDQVIVVNTGTTPVILDANSALFIKRVA